MLKQMSDVTTAASTTTTTPDEVVRPRRSAAASLGAPQQQHPHQQGHQQSPVPSSGNSIPVDNGGVHQSNGRNGFDGLVIGNMAASNKHVGKDHPRKSSIGNSRDELGDGPEKGLLVWHDMPKHLQFNPYIHTGYRPMLSFWGCINSLLYFHNETINILTHAIPILYILLTVPDMLPWSASAQHWFLCWCHMLGLVCPWIGSFIYHLFMNLERDEKVYYRLLQVDMLGIWINQSFGALPMVTATTYCLPLPVRWFFISAYCLMSLRGFYKAMTAWSPWERRLCFLFPFTIRMVLLMIRSTSYGGGDPGSYIHIVLEDLVSVIGAAIGAMHIPEKWYPGTVDLYLNSHNIMHVLVVAAVYSMHAATVRDLHWMGRSTCHAGAGAL